MGKKLSLKKSREEIIFQDVCKSFGEKKVLQNLSLSIAQGESLVIIGCSGVGKSVLLRAALGLIDVDHGSICLKEQAIEKLSGKQREKLFRDIGVVFQSSALFDSLNVFENIAFCLPEKKQSTKDRVHELLMAVGLPQETAGLYPSELSGGMKHRVALARAVALKPNILFFDEPTSGLDPVSAHTIATLIRTCLNDIKATAITITHDMVCAKTVADRVAFLDQGKISWQGSPDDLYSTKDSRVRQFVGGTSKGPLAKSVQ